MGCCLDCMRPQVDAHERTPLTNEGRGSRRLPLEMDGSSSGGGSKGERDNHSSSRSNGSAGDDGSGINSSKSQSGEAYYQMIVDEAKGKFLNNTTRGRAPSNGQPESSSVRSSFLNVISGREFVVSASPPARTVMDRHAHPHLTSEDHNVVNILSEPRPLPADADLIADEIGELVARHTFKVQVDDGSSALVQFRTVTK